MTGRDVAALIGTIRRLWPTVPWNVPDTQMAQLVDEWTAVYDGFTLAEVTARLVWCVRNGHTFPPGPATLVSLCLAERDRAAGLTAPDADEAWSEVLDAVRSRGWYYGPPSSWSHTAIAETVRTLSWRVLCHAENMTVLHGQFVRAYKSIVQRAHDERRRTEMTALGTAERPQLPQGGTHDTRPALDP